MKILLTGSAGMLGTALRPALKRRGHDLIATDLVAQDPEVQPLDVRDPSQVNGLIEKTKPALVMHLAAETDVDKCQVDADHAYRTNAIGTQNVALACRKADIELVYISTSAVFSGDKAEPYTEFDEPCPANTYADSKLQGEKIVRELLKKSYICRASWMIGGGGKKDKKFLNKVMQQITKGAKEIKAVNDKIGTPTYTADLSECLADLIETRLYGLYHMGNVGFCSRFDMAKKAFEVLGLSAVKLFPVSSDAFPSPAPRGRSEAIRNYMLELRGMNTMRPWQDALAEYVLAEFK